MSDLAEYAYCPRAHWYRHHPPPVPLEPTSLRRRRSGTRYHQHQLALELTAERHRDRWVVVALVAATVLAGTALWWLWT